MELTTGSGGIARVREERLTHPLDPLAEAPLRAQPAPEDDERRVERVREHGERPAQGGRGGVHERRVRRIRKDVLGALQTGRAGERSAARHRLDRWRTEHDGLAAPACVGAAVDDEARARARADDREEERRDARAGAEARLRERGCPQVGLDHDPRRVDRRRRVDAAPVDRVRARRPSREVDQLAQPDPDGQPAVAEFGDERCTVAQHGRAASLRARRHPTPIQDRSGGRIDDAGCDLRSADVYPERDGHLDGPRGMTRRFRSAAPIAL